MIYSQYHDDFFLYDNADFFTLLILTMMPVMVLKMMVMVVMRVMMFEMDEMMASEGPPDRSTRLDSREALSAPTLAIPRTRIQWRNSNTCNTYTCKTPIKRHNTNTCNTHACITTAEDMVAQHAIPIPTIPTHVIPHLQHHGQHTS